MRPKIGLRLRPKIAARRRRITLRVSRCSRWAITTFQSSPRVAHGSTSSNKGQGRPIPFALAAVKHVEREHAGFHHRNCAHRQSVARPRNSPAAFYLLTMPAKDSKRASRGAGARGGWHSSGKDQGAPLGVPEWQKQGWVVEAGSGARATHRLCHNR